MTSSSRRSARRFPDWHPTATEVLDVRSTPTVSRRPHPRPEGAIDASTSLAAAGARRRSRPRPRRDHQRLRGRRGPEHRPAVDRPGSRVAVRRGADAEVRRPIDPAPDGLARDHAARDRLAAGALRDAADRQRSTEAKAAALQAVLDSAVRDGAPDAYAAVITKDGIWAGAAGTGGPDGRAATAKDEFYLASVTQVFTTALILRLAEEGRIDLDAPLASYLGDLEVDTNGATVRQALGMRSGLPDFGPERRRAPSRRTRGTCGRVEEIVTHFVKPTASPGSAWIHAGPNFVLLARRGRARDRLVVLRRPARRGARSGRSDEDRPAGGRRGDAEAVGAADRARTPRRSRSPTTARMA